MSDDGKRELDTTLGSTLPDPRPDHGERPKLATFDHPEDRFQLGAELGRGGMGRVLAATDISLGRPVAIKQVLSDRADDLIRFEREVRITANLEHPAITPIHEAARDAEGRPYYVMRRIEGDPLDHRLAGDLRARLALLPNLLAVVDAAAFAHARHIIHRDIKPSNILLGAYGETHLIDWGLARRLDDLDVSGVRRVQDDNLTQVGQVYGTVGYMAPEQARGEPVDARADVYALGATLFHVIAGRAPFAHMSQAERLLAAVTGDDRVPLDSIPTDVPPELIAIVDKAMARDPEARYEHAGELAADLRAFLGGKLVAAHRYTTGERFRRFLRQHRVAVALAAISLVAIAVISVIAISQIVEERDVAEAQEQQANARADLLLIERASTLAPTEPNRAAALLLQLPANTPHARRARDAISKVAAYGVGHGAAKHVGPTNGMAFSPDGRQLVSVGEDGLIVRYDVATGRAERLLDLHAPLYQVKYIDDRTLLVTGKHLGRLVDVPTATARPFSDVEELFRWWPAGDRIRYLDSGSQAIYELAIASGTKRELARDVVDAIGLEQVAIFTTSSGVFVLDGDVVRPLEVVKNPIMTMSVRPDGQRVAASTINETIEWDVATGKQAIRWPVGGVLGLAYSTRALIAFGSDSVLSLLFGNGAINRRPVKVAPLWNVQIETGLVFGFEDGKLMVFDDGGIHTVENQHVGTRSLASTRNGMLVAVGSRDGTVRWLDLTNVTPRPSKIEGMHSLCTATDRHIYANGPDGILEVEIATQRRRKIESTRPDLHFGMDCTYVMGSHVIAFSPVGLSIIDLVKSNALTIDGGTTPGVDFARAVFGVGAELFEIGPSHSEPRKIFTAPSKIEVVAIRDQWIVMLLADRRLLRLHRATGETVSFNAEAEFFGIHDSGNVFYATGNRLMLWDGATHLVATFEDQIRKLLRYEDNYYVELANGSMWAQPDHGPMIQKIPVGVRLLALGGRGMAVGSTTQLVTTHYLATGESISRDFTQVNRAIPVLDGRGVLVRSADYAMLFLDPVPLDFDAAMAWLRGATNARIEERTNALYWQ